MAITAQECANRKINVQMCPCTNVGCGNRGICCQCLQAHAAGGSISACMRGAKRDPATMSLTSLAVAFCPVNRENNLAFCGCTYEPCNNKGTCCSCVRNHFKTDGSGRTACMRN